jgi:hypothetical protein
MSPSFFDTPSSKSANPGFEGLPFSVGNHAMSRTHWFDRFHRSYPGTFPIVMYNGHPVAVPEKPPSRVLSDVKMMGIIVLLSRVRELLSILVFSQNQVIHCRYLSVPPPVGGMQICVYSVPSLIIHSSGSPNDFVIYRTIFEDFLQDGQWISHPRLGLVLPVWAFDFQLLPSSLRSFKCLQALEKVPEASEEPRVVVAFVVRVSNPPILDF